MTAGALDANAQEQLRGILGAVGGRCAGPIVIGGRIVEGAPLGRQQRGGKLVVGHVVAHGLDQPAMEFVYSGRGDLARFDAQQVGPLERPKLGKFRPLEQAINQPAAFVGGRIGQKRFDLLRRGQNADHVQMDAADELAISTQGRRLDLQQLELFVDQRVDVVLLWRIRPAESLDVAQERQRRRGQFFQVADHDHGFAPIAGHDQAPGRDAGHAAGRTGVDRQTSDVAHRAVGKMCHDRKLLRMRRPMHGPLWRVNLDLAANRCVGRIALATAGDPVVQDFIRRILGSQPPAAAVRNFQQRLGQQQALLRLEWIRAATKALADQRQLVERRIVAQQRQAEAAFARRRAVTRAGVAALLGQGHHRPVAKRLAGNRLLAGHRHGHLEPMSADSGDHPGGAIGHGGCKAAGQGQDPWIARRECRGPRQVLRLPSA